MVIVDCPIGVAVGMAAGDKATRTEIGGDPCCAGTQAKNRRERSQAEDYLFHRSFQHPHCGLLSTLCSLRSRGWRVPCRHFAATQRPYAPMLFR